MGLIGYCGHGVALSARRALFAASTKTEAALYPEEHRDDLRFRPGGKGYLFHTSVPAYFPNSCPEDYRPAPTCSESRVTEH